MGALDVDEVIAQLLTSEGFTNMEEVAYVELEELSEIDGFDEETAQELQTRAREYLETLAAENENKRKELGVEDAVAGIEGISAKMLVALGENDIKTLEDLAGCATDDLLGWNEVVDGERKHMDGIFESFEVVADEANAFIMAARVAAGWITQEDLDAMNAPEEEEGEDVVAEDAVDA